MKMIIEESIKKYLPSLKLVGRAIKLKNLPLVYKSLYSFQQLDIGSQSFLVIYVKDKTLGPRDFKKHEKTLQEIIHYPQLWFFEELHFNKVQRMIENEFNFVVQGKQVHLPSVSISIKATHERVPIKAQLSGLAVNILIREVLKDDIEGKSKVEIANVFGITKMAALRAIELLLANNLCEVKKEAVEKKIYFSHKTELWKYLKEKIKSPVKKIIFTNTQLKELPLSGLSALSHKTMLASDEITTFAIDQRKFKREFSNIKFVLEDAAKYRIEIWDRMPILLSNGIINLIDIFLVNRDISDERVQIELEKLMKSHHLPIGS